MKNIDKYADVFSSVFGLEKDRFDAAFNFKDVDAWDSMTHLMLISELEEAFDVLFETEDILHFGGYMNGIEILKKYGVDFGN